MLASTGVDARSSVGVTPMRATQIQAVDRALLCCPPIVTKRDPHNSHASEDENRPFAGPQLFLSQKTPK